MPSKPFATDLSGAPAYWSLGELGEPAQARTLPPPRDEPDGDRVITLAAHYGAEVLADWP